MPKKGYIPKAPIRELMKEVGAEIVAQDALVYVIEKGEEYIRDLTRKGLEIAKVAKRRTLKKEDIEAATRISKM